MSRKAIFGRGTRLTALRSHMPNMLRRLALPAERHGPDLTSRFMKTPH